MGVEIIYLIYMYKKYLAFNIQQWLICHRTKPNQTNLSLKNIYFKGTRVVMIILIGNIILDSNTLGKGINPLFFLQLEVNRGDCLL